MNSIFYHSGKLNLNCLFNCFISSSPPSEAWPSTLVHLSPLQFTDVSLPTDTFYLPEQPSPSYVHTLHFVIFLSFYPPTYTLARIFVPAFWIHCLGKLRYLPTPSDLQLIHHLTLLTASSAAQPSLANSSSWIIAARKKISMHTRWVFSASPQKVYPFPLILTLFNWRAQF